MISTSNLIRIAEQSEAFAKDCRALATDDKGKIKPEHGHGTEFMGSAASGRVRRKSIDLTRSLAQLRHPHKDVTP